MPPINLFMRKLVILLMFLISTAAVSQEIFEQELHARDISKNEFSANVLNLLVVGALDVTYERILSGHSSFSVNLFTKLLNKNGETDVSEIYYKDISLTSKYKFFFSERKTAWGFYTEAFAMISNGDNERYVEYQDPTTGYWESETEEDNYTDFALGIGLGYKYVAKQGLVIDLSFGVGRNLFHKDSPTIVTLSAINFGYRF